MFKRKENINLNISVALMSSFIVLMLQFSILSVTKQYAPSITGNIQIVSKMIVGFLYTKAFISIAQKEIKNIILIYLLSLIIFALNYLVFFENRIFLMKSLSSFFLISLPSFVLAYSLTDYSLFYRTMKQFAKYIFSIGIVVSAFVIFGVLDLGTYSMSFSYYMLLPAIIFLNEALNNYRVREITYLFISLLIILLLGSRGPLLSLAVFFLFKLFNKYSMKNVKSMLKLMTLLVTLTFLFFYFSDIVKIINEVFVSKGIYSRTLKLFSNNLTYVSGRDEIFNVLLDEIRKYPIFGLGIFVDRRILYGRNEYAHNIFLEIILNFGIINGLILIFLLLFIILIPMFSRTNKYKDLYIVWFSIGFVHLLISSSYLIDLKFWILLGLSLKFQKSRRIKHEKSS